MLDPTTAARTIQTLLPPSHPTPSFAIICGSGLSTLGDLITDPISIGYDQIPGFGEVSVSGHQSRLLFGTLGGRGVVCLLGRFHAYEGHDMKSVVFPVRVLVALGVKGIVITNAAGGLQGDEVGTVIVVRDHISLPSLTSMNPLIGPNPPNGGPRFPALSNAYDFDLAVTAFKASKKLGWEEGSIREGVYAWVAGPSYETRAEQKFLKTAGADVVGMSTIPEVIVAAHSGLKIIVLSLITNKVVDGTFQSAQQFVKDELAGKTPVKLVEEYANHEEVLAASKTRTEAMRGLVEEIIRTAQV